jgi:3-oxoacyl-(acyl-carrier-protein) synthase
MQLVQLVETMRQGLLPGIPGLNELDAGFPLPMAGPENREIDARVGMVNSVGHHGSCCTVVVAREGRP